MRLRPAFATSLCAVLGIFAALFAAPASAFIIEPSLLEAARGADLVVVANPVKLDRLEVSGSVAYELGTFEVTRILASSLSYVDGIELGEGPLRICVLRLTKTAEIHFEEKALEVGKAYILVLNKLVPDGCYSPLSSYHKIPEATDENLKAMRKALYGAEEERFATDALPLADAQALAAKLIPELLTACCEESLKRALAADRRVVLVSGDGFFYCPLKLDPEKGFATAGDVVPDGAEPIATTKDGCRFYVTDLEINGIAIRRLLLAVREVEIPGFGKGTVRLYLKMEAGAVGEIAPRKASD